MKISNESLAMAMTNNGSNDINNNGNRNGNVMAIIM